VAEPSIYDRDWAMPNFSYFISSIVKGKAKETYSWRLQPDRTAFESEPIEILN